MYIILGKKDRFHVRKNKVTIVTFRDRSVIVYRVVMGTLGIDPDHLSFIDAFFGLSVWELKM